MGKLRKQQKKRMSRFICAQLPGLTIRPVVARSGPVHQALSTVVRNARSYATLSVTTNLSTLVACKLPPPIRLRFGRLQQKTVVGIA